MKEKRVNAAPRYCRPFKETDRKMTKMFFWLVFLGQTKAWSRLVGLQIHTYTMA